MEKKIQKSGKSGNTDCLNSYDYNSDTKYTK